MREEYLIEQLASLMSKINLDEVGMKEKIKAEIERCKKFQSGLLGFKNTIIKVADIDIRNYAKYILREGVITEKRELLSCLRNKIKMGDKRVELQQI